MFIKNNKGAALMQVLLVTVVLAGMAAMLLRATLSRTRTARHTRRSVSTQLMVDSCMAEVNSLWASKSPQAFLGDFNGDSRGAFMYCESYTDQGVCDNATAHRYYDCNYQIDNISYTVRAWLYDNASDTDGYPKEDFTGKEENGKLQMVFEVLNSEGASL